MISHHLTVSLTNKIDIFKTGALYTSKKINDILGLGLWCLTPLLTIFQLLTISCRSVLFVEESEVSGENHQSVASDWQTLSHRGVSITTCLGEIRTHSFSGDRH